MKAERWSSVDEIDFFLEIEGYVMHKLHWKAILTYLEARADAGDEEARALFTKEAKS